MISHPIKSKIKPDIKNLRKIIIIIEIDENKSETNIGTKLHKKLANRI
jgi:hypothetical protein